MKIIVLTLVIFQVISLKEIDQVKTEPGKDIPKRVGSESEGYYYTFDSSYYTTSPVYYTYTPTSYYYVYDPYASFYYTTVETPVTYSYVTYPFVWRKGAEEEKEKSFDLNKAQKELTLLKKEVWGKEEYSTDEIRKSGKVYDSRWLISQLKITRTLELEDMIKNHGKFEEKKGNLREDKKEEKKKEDIKE